MLSNRNLLFQGAPIFRGHVSFRKGKRKNFSFAFSAPQLPAGFWAVRPPSWPRRREFPPPMPRRKRTPRRQFQQMVRELNTTKTPKQCGIEDLASWKMTMGILVFDIFFVKRLVALCGLVALIIWMIFIIMQAALPQLVTLIEHPSQVLADAWFNDYGNLCHIFAHPHDTQLLLLI